jgi:hypothetical protein
MPVPSTPRSEPLLDVRLIVSLEPISVTFVTVPDKSKLEFGGGSRIAPVGEPALLKLKDALP